ncbi:Uncharacterised protein [Streptococcus pneumoniae]|nr:Uncharacterised protein [Streptococcus pneumoniae]
MKIPLLTLARHKFVYVLLTLLFLALVYRDVLMTYFFEVAYEDSSLNFGKA